MKIKLFLLIMASFIWSAQAYETPSKIIGSSTFRLSLKPIDSDSLDARTAELYITRFPQSGWLYEGRCDPDPQNSQNKIFNRVVKVAGDGEYYFISRGGDAAGMSPPPLNNDKPQIKIIVDTTSPKLRFIAPAAGTILQAGQQVSIEWVADDTNMALTPIDIFYTDGKSEEWQQIALTQPNTGRFNWQVPLAEYSNMRLKITCRDKAGNTAEITSPAGYKVMLPQKETQLFQADLPVAVELTPAAPALLSRQVETIPAVEEMKKDSPVKKYLTEDPRPQTAYPQLDANDASIPKAEKDVGRAAYVAYVMGGNLVRQGRLKDSLRYYRTAVDADPNFHHAWNDLALIYKQLGAFSKADSCIVKALALVPDSPRYLNTRGAIYQAAGFEILQDPASAEESLARANDLILFSVKNYGDAIAAAQKEGKLAECAETYFHLGEICYFANQDPTGARQYWIKILDLHSPTPDLDNIILDRDTPQEQLSQSIYEKNTELWVDLKSWQMWAREYLQQLNNLERGLIDPRAPISTGQFQQYANPNLGAQYNTPQAASPQVYSLNPAGNYPGTEIVRQPQAEYIIPQQQGVDTYIPLQANTIPPQGKWSRADYGSAPDYTYRNQ